MGDMAKKLSGLLGSVYDAAGDATLWAPLVEDLARRTGATSAALVIQAYDQDLYSISSSWHAREEFIRTYQQYYHKLDAWAEIVVPRPSEYPSGCAYTSQSLIPRVQMEKKEFYHDYLVPGGVEDALIGLVENSQSCVAAVVLYRDKSREEFGDPELKMLQFLAPHLRRAFGLYRNFSAIKSRGEGIERTVDKLPTGVVFLDSKGQIIFMNRSAAALIAERDGLLATSDGLHSEQQRESNLLASTISRAASTSNGQGVSTGGTVLISRRARPPLQLVISPIRTATISISKRIAAVAFIYDPLRPQRPAQEVLRTLFGLSPAECRVALLLSDGHAPRRIAEIVGVSIETVRSQMKRIFSKTNVKRQSELIRLLLSHAGFTIQPK
jgi:DNA-binding CsgD family transcriptional regulator